MANCEYCGKPAGLFRSMHKECAVQRDQARADIDTAFRNLLVVERPPSPAIFRAIIEKLADDARLDDVAFQKTVLAGLGIALDVVLTEFDLPHNVIRRLQTIIEAFNLSASAVDRPGIRDRLVKALVIADLSEGKVSKRLSMTSSLPIALKPNETVQWLFDSVTLNERETGTSYRASHGFFVRLLEGVSYRVDSYKGQRVERTGNVRIGTGSLIVTTIAIYFLNGRNSKRTPLPALVSVDAHANGITVSPSRGRQQIYVMPDPMFAANLIRRVAAFTC
jgi:hypothetical protein